MPNIIEIPATHVPPASNARLLYDQGRLEETVAFCQKELPLLERQLPTKSQRVPSEEQPDSAPYQYHALTAILVDAECQLDRWKAAKETLGRYRVRFPRDPWGYNVGATVTRRDPEVKDREAVSHAAGMLEEEARRLEGKAPSRKKTR